MQSYRCTAHQLPGCYGPRCWLALQNQAPWVSKPECSSRPSRTPAFPADGLCRAAALLPWPSTQQKSTPRFFAKSSCPPPLALRHTMTHSNCTGRWLRRQQVCVWRTAVRCAVGACIGRRIVAIVVVPVPVNLNETQRDREIERQRERERERPRRTASCA